MPSKKQVRNEFGGKWRIDKMELWDKDYVDMEVKAYIQIDRKRMGHFQFGLVSGEIDGEMVQWPDRKRFEFTWEGQDECDPVHGSGWVEREGLDSIKGRFKFYGGDGSDFRAKRMKK